MAYFIFISWYSCVRAQHSGQEFKWSFTFFHSIAFIATRFIHFFSNFNMLRLAPYFLIIVKKVRNNQNNYFMQSSCKIYFLLLPVMLKEGWGPGGVRGIMLEHLFLLSCYYM